MSQIFNTINHLIKHIVYLFIILLEQVKKSLLIFVQVTIIFFLLLTYFMETFELIFEENSSGSGA